MRVRKQHWAIGISVAAILSCFVSCDTGPPETAGRPTEHFAAIRRSFRCSGLHRSEFSISYLDTGAVEHEAVVLLHGFGASVYTWRDLISVLAEDHRVIALDLKGFGASDKPDDGRYSVFDQAEVVDALIRHLELEEVILGGHSMGGTIAVALACETPSERPYRIGSLMLFDAPLFRQRLPLFIMALDIPLLGEAALHFIPPATIVYWGLKEAYYEDGLVEDEAVRAYAAGLAAPGGRKALVRTASALADLNASGHAFDFDEIVVPVLIVWGKNDTVVPPGGAYALRDALAGPVSFNMLADCGHFPMTEKPQDTLAAVEEFLESN